MRIIAITNQKGGCGKTTTSINLSATLAVNGRRVLLIDLDPQAHATLGLNLAPEFSIYNVLSKLTNKKVRLADIILNVSGNFDIAPSSIVLSTLEQELAGEISRESRLWEILANFESKYDYILIDCPPNLGILTINAIRAANEIIIPVEASRFSLEGLSQLIDIIALIQDRLKHVVNYQVLVTNFDSRLRHSFKILDYIKSTFSKNLFSNIIHVNVKLKEAQSQGTHVLNYDKYCRGAKDYFSLAREIITQENNLIADKTADNTAASITDQMKKAIKKNLPKLNELVFSITAPEAKAVHLVGDFNNWQLDETSTMSANNGAWTKRLPLTPGKYHYRFVVDGNWVEDPENPLTAVNPFGQMNSLIEIKNK
jgi:chromosome partitioning protein